MCVCVLACLRVHVFMRLWFQKIIHHIQSYWVKSPQKMANDVSNAILCRRDSTGLITPFRPSWFSYGFRSWQNCRDLRMIQPNAPGTFLAYEHIFCSASGLLACGSGGRRLTLIKGILTWRLIGGEAFASSPYLCCGRKTYAVMWVRTCIKP